MPLIIIIFKSRVGNLYFVKDILWATPFSGRHLKDKDSAQRATHRRGEQTTKKIDAPWSLLLSIYNKWQWTRWTRGKRTGKKAIHLKNHCKRSTLEYIETRSLLCKRDSSLQTEEKEEQQQMKKKGGGQGHQWLKITTMPTALNKYIQCRYKLPYFVYYSKEQKKFKELEQKSVPEGINFQSRSPWTCSLILLSVQLPRNYPSSLPRNVHPSDTSR